MQLWSMRFPEPVDFSAAGWRNGSFGICLHCDEEISLKRLKAVPWTPYCIRCQEAVDRHDFESAEAVDDLLANAA